MAEVSQGVQQLLTPVIADTTASIASLHDAQTQLSAELAQLQSKLEEYVKASEGHDLRPSLAILKETSRRLKTVNETIRLMEVRLLGVKKELIMKRGRNSTTR